MAFALSANAQSTGSIRGTVADNTGAAILAVTVTDPATGLTRTDQSNPSGLFVFPDLPTGNYTIAKPGFQTQRRTATELLTGQTLGLKITLTVGSPHRDRRSLRRHSGDQDRLLRNIHHRRRKTGPGPPHQLPQPPPAHHPHPRHRPYHRRHRVGPAG